MSNTLFASKTGPAHSRPEAVSEWGPAHLRPEHEFDFEFEGRPEDN